jgi:outer membrane protein
MMKHLVAVCALACLLPQVLAAQEPVALPDSLSLEQAVQIAVENHPSLRQADATLRSASGGKRLALSAYFPNVSAVSSATRTGGVFVFNPSVPRSNQFYDTYTAGFQASQTLFDFGRTINKVSASSSFEQAAGADHEAARQNVIMNVQLDYYGLMQAHQVEMVNEEDSARTMQHLAEAKAFYTVGKRAQFDVTRAEVDVANATVNLIRARNQTRLAKAQLENAMGIRPRGPYHISTNFDVPVFPVGLDSIESITLNQRPDLVAARAELEANRSLAAAAWDQHLPTLTASGTYTWSNFEFPLYSRWNAGVTISLPLFQGFAITAQVDQARANADASQAALDLLTQSIDLEVEQDYLSLNEAHDRISSAMKLVEQAEQNLTLAEKQYAAGVGTALEVTDAQQVLSNARITRIQALFDYNSFFTRLKRAMGILGN